MPLDLFAALVVFACVMAFTPGPNNILLAASGVNFGFTRTIPHMAGVAFGFFILLAACAAGLGLVFAAVPALHIALKVVGAVYMLWLAYKVATAHLSNDTKAPAQPFTFWQAAAFQWVNPKGVVAAISGVAIYVRPGPPVARYPDYVGSVFRRDHWLGSDLVGLWRRAAGTAAAAVTGAHLQFRHGAAAGRQHRADGADVVSSSPWA